MAQPVRRFLATRCGEGHRSELHDRPLRAKGVPAERLGGVVEPHAVVTDRDGGFAVVLWALRDVDAHGRECRPRVGYPAPVPRFRHARLSAEELRRRRLILALAWLQVGAVVGGQAVGRKLGQRAA
jgi:hypothetical protein